MFFLCFLLTNVANVLLWLVSCDEPSCSVFDVYNTLCHVSRIIIICYCVSFSIMQLLTANKPSYARVLLQVLCYVHSVMWTVYGVAEKVDEIDTI